MDELDTPKTVKVNINDLFNTSPAYGPDFLTVLTLALSYKLADKFIDNPKVLGRVVRKQIESIVEELG